MCSSPHWQVGSSWFREKLSPANRNKGYRGEQISRKIVSRELNARSYRDFAKILRSWAPRLQNSRNRWAKKWGPTCDRDISNSAIYTTAIYRAYTVYTVSDNLNFTLYADDTTLSSPMCSFSSGCDGDVECVSILINLELNKIADWLAVNKLSLNVQKNKLMIFHYRQRILTENDIPRLMINKAIIERVTEFNFLGLTVNEYMNWNTHTQKIANKISRTLGIMNRLKRYLPFSAMKLMYDSLILSHLQFGITNGRRS